MNAHGVSVFYGATQPHFALGEVRPPVGSRVVVAQFQILRPIRLLNVEALRSLLVPGSVFDTTYIARLQKASFLRRLSRRIVAPIMPDDETLDYLITQVISDYLANRPVAPLDGLLFPSVQVSDGINITLFHRAARVEALSFPENTEISANLVEWTEDGPEVDYTVLEKVGPPSGVGPRATSASPLSVAAANDRREPSLRIETTDLNVYHVNSVKFDAVSHPVQRLRFESRDLLRFGEVHPPDSQGGMDDT